MSDHLNNFECSAFQALLSKGFLNVDFDWRDGWDSVYRMSELELRTTAGPIAVRVTHIQLGTMGCDEIFVAFGDCLETGNPKIYVRVFIHALNESCWVEHLTTLHEPNWAHMEVVITAIED
jgi:hypothetical protein